MRRVIYLLPVGKAGLLDLNLVGTYLLESSIGTPVFGYDCAGYFGNACGEPNARGRHRATVFWETSFNTVFSLGWRMIGPSTNDAASPDPDLGNPDLVEDFESSGSLELRCHQLLRPLGDLRRRQGHPAHRRGQQPPRLGATAGGRATRR